MPLLMSEAHRQGGDLPEIMHCREGSGLDYSISYAEADSRSYGSWATCRVVLTLYVYYEVENWLVGWVSFSRPPSDR